MLERGVHAGGEEVDDEDADARVDFMNFGIEAHAARERSSQSS